MPTWPTSESPPVPSRRPPGFSRSRSDTGRRRIANGGAVDVRSDLYGLAAVVAHLLVGSQPERLDLGALDEPFHDVLARGLAVDPEDRYDSVDDFLDHLLAPVGGTDDLAGPKRRSRNPYKGLAAFTEQDAPDFFGRSDEIERLVDLVSENRLSAVVGPSGSGKSSLTLAGLLPALAAGAVPGSETWISVRAVPGGYPFDELAIALGALSTEPLSASRHRTRLPRRQGSPPGRQTNRPGTGRRPRHRHRPIRGALHPRRRRRRPQRLRRRPGHCRHRPVEPGQDRADPAGRLLPSSADPAICWPDHRTGPSRSHQPRRRRYPAGHCRAGRPRRPPVRARPTREDRCRSEGSAGKPAPAPVHPRPSRCCRLPTGSSPTTTTSNSAG